MIGVFIFACFTVIQLGLIAIAKFQIDHLAFNAARLWSVKTNADQDDLDESIYNVTRIYQHSRGNDSSAVLIGDDFLAASGGFPLLMLSRDYGAPPNDAFIANTLIGQVEAEESNEGASSPEKGIRFYGWIPLLIPGVAHMIVDRIDQAAVMPPICRAGALMPFASLFTGPLGTGQGIAACWAESLGLSTMRAVPVEVFIPIEPEPPLAPDSPPSGLIKGCGGNDEPRCYDNDTW